MEKELVQLIEAIHAAPEKLVYEFTGAGSLALYWLHCVPGSSQTILEATDRYAQASLSALLGEVPEKFVSQKTAEEMAKKAYERARFLSEDTCLGVSCTASIATSRPKRGAHHCFVAVKKEEDGFVYGLTLKKGGRDRQGEEEVVSRLVLYGIARACGIEELPSLGLFEEEKLSEQVFSPTRENQ